MEIPMAASNPSFTSEAEFFMQGISDRDDLITAFELNFTEYVCKWNLFHIKSMSWTEC